MALAGGREIDQRAIAMVNRTVIGQAEGILMERVKVTPDRAFELLRQASLQSNNRLIRVAEELTRTGDWTTLGDEVSQPS